MKITDEMKHKVWSKVHKAQGVRACWLWTASTKDGWGQIVLPINGEQKAFRAHRLSYMLELGPIPVGKEIHQTCGNKLCVRPDHLLLAEERQPRGPYGKRT
jgi:HNH endonuclease